MPSGAVAESVEHWKNLPHLLRSSWLQQGRVATESEGLGTWDFEANTELSHLAFSRAQLVVMPFEEREGMEGRQTQETELTRYHQVLEGRDKFESSFLRLVKYCFLALLRVDTLVDILGEYPPIGDLIFFIFSQNMLRLSWYKPFVLRIGSNEKLMCDLCALKPNKIKCDTWNGLNWELANLPFLN